MERNRPHYHTELALNIHYFLLFFARHAAKFVNETHFPILPFLSFEPHARIQNYVIQRERKGYLSLSGGPRYIVGNSTMYLRNLNFSGEGVGQPPPPPASTSAHEPTHVSFVLAILHAAKLTNSEFQESYDKSALYFHYTLVIKQKAAIRYIKYILYMYINIVLAFINRVLVLVYQYL